MPFFQQGDDRKKQDKHAPIKKVDLRRAQTLENALRTKGKIINNNIQIKKWAESFSKLRGIVDAEQIERALDWYISQIGKDFVPRVLSANTFVARFIDIADAMKRNSKHRGKPQNLVISDLARWIDDHYQYIWNHGEEKDVLLFIELCLQSWQDFRDRLLTATEEERAKAQACNDSHPGRSCSGDWSLHNHLAACLERWGHPDQYVPDWLQEMNSISNTAKHWKGNLFKHIMHPTHPRMEWRIIEWAAESRGESSVWDEIKQRIGI